MLHQSSLGAAFLVLAAIGCCAATAFAAAPEPERRETVVDNIPVVYVDAGPRDGEALVFIHGWASNLTFWQAQMDAFQGRYRCIAIDMPGFGRSGKPQDIDYDLDLYARAIAAAVDDAGVTNPVLIGHSMGFAMARQFLVRYPGVARAVVNVDGTYFPVPPTEEGRAEWEKNTQGLAQSFAGPGRDDMMKQFTEWVFMGKTREDVRAVVRPVMLAVDPYVMTNSMIEFVDPKWWAPLHFDVPSLALYAENPMEDPNIEALLRAEYPNLTFVKWNDTGHFLMMEEPERFNATLQDYLDRLPDQAE